MSKRHSNGTTIAKARARKPKTSAGATIGVLAGLDQAGVPLVDFAGNQNGFRAARTTVALDERHVGQEVALVFEEDDPARPIILGVLQKPGRPAKTLQVRVDGETISLAADKELALQCGKAVIHLAQDGKVTIRGTYLLSRSSGVNRILGGSVQLN